MNNKPLHLFVGPSASGKTSVANILEDPMYAWNKVYKQIQSYTTRPPRYDGEKGHVFISDDEFNKLTDLVAYTEYNGYKYGTTQEQLDEVDIYVVDIPGVETLLENYESRRVIYIWYFDSHITTRIERMILRGDLSASIISRLRTDEAFNWYDKLQILVDYFTTFKNKKVFLEKVNAEVELRFLANEMNSKLGG